MMGRSGQTNATTASVDCREIVHAEDFLDDDCSVDEAI